MRKCKYIYEQLTLEKQVDQVCSAFGAAAVRFCRGNPNGCPSSKIREEMRRKKEHERLQILRTPNSGSGT